MFQSVVRFFVHAMFGVSVLTAFAARDEVHAADQTTKLRESRDVDHDTTEATATPSAPRVLNRWDMKRRPEATSGTEQAPRGPRPVVVTVQNASSNPLSTQISAATEVRGTATTGVACVAGCSR
jgi:hypothetical protein